MHNLKNTHLDALLKKSFYLLEIKIAVIFSSESVYRSVQYKKNITRLNCDWIGAQFCLCMFLESIDKPWINCSKMSVDSAYKYL